MPFLLPTVALLAEGVDRNCFDGKSKKQKIVALLAEGVDRNSGKGYITQKGWASPSSRRAWIEIIRLLSAGEDPTSRPPRGGRG